MALGDTPVLLLSLVKSFDFAYILLPAGRIRSNTVGARFSDSPFDFGSAVFFNFEFNARFWISNLTPHPMGWGRPEGEDGAVPIDALGGHLPRGLQPLAALRTGLINGCYLHCLW